LHIFLAGKGVDAAQKPSRAGGCSGLPVALSVAMVPLWVEVVDGWVAVV